MNDLTDLKFFIGSLIRPLIKEAVAEALQSSLPIPNKSSLKTEEEPPLNVEGAAHFLGIAPQTLYQNVKRIPHIKRFGKLYFLRSELMAYLEAGKQKSLSN